MLNNSSIQYNIRMGEVTSGLGGCLSTPKFLNQVGLVPE